MKVHRFTTSILRIPLLAAFPIPGPMAGAATITFESAADLSSFNRTSGTGSLAHNNTGRYITFSAVSNTNMFAYDQNGATSGIPTFNVPADHSLTVSADVRFTEGGPNVSTTSSLGIYFGSYLGLLNVSPTTDSLRLGTNLTSDGAISTFSGTGVSGVDLVPVGVNAAFTRLSLSMTPIDAMRFSLSVTAGSRTYTQTIESPMPTDFQIGFRAYNVTGSTNAIHIDNFSVEVVPEPSSALLLLGALPLACLRRRGRD